MAGGCTTWPLDRHRAASRGSRSAPQAPASDSPGRRVGQHLLASTAWTRCSTRCITAHSKQEKDWPLLLVVSTARPGDPSLSVSQALTASVPVLPAGADHLQQARAEASVRVWQARS